MDFTFLTATLIGVSITVLTYSTPKAVYIRDGLGKTDTANRILLVTIPGLTIMCFGITLFEVFGTYATGLSPWRVWGIPAAVLIAMIGLGISLWSLIPSPAPLWLQPKWMKQQNIQHALTSLNRVEKAQQRRKTNVNARGFEYFETQAIDGVSLAYPQGWVLNLEPGKAPKIPQLKLRARFSIDTPHDYRPRARILLFNSPLPENDSTEETTPPQTTSENNQPDTSYPLRTSNYLRHLVVPAGWEVLEVKTAYLAGNPAIFATSREPKHRGIQQRWAAATSDSLWMLAFQVAESKFGALNGIGTKVAATLTLPDTERQNPPAENKNSSEPQGQTNA